MAIKPDAPNKDNLFLTITIYKKHSKFGYVFRTLKIDETSSHYYNI